jgi:hypothetical protein
LRRDLNITTLASSTFSMELPYFMESRRTLIQSTQLRESITFVDAILHSVRPDRAEKRCLQTT